MAVFFFFVMFLPMVFMLFMTFTINGEVVFFYEDFQLKRLR